MEKEFLSLIPERFLCPYCGEWHEWNKPYHLGQYSSGYPAKFGCSSCPGSREIGSYQIYFEDDYLSYSVSRICGRANQIMNGKIQIFSIQESFEEPRVTFDVDFTSANSVGRRQCYDCDFDKECNFCKLGSLGDGCNMRITFGFEFKQSDYDKFAKSAQFARKLRELQALEKALQDKEQSLQERESALSSKEQAYEQQQQRAEELAREQEIKEETTMANNNIFNMNLEFGPNKDENIASTLMGVAVKNGDSWRIYDKKKKEITDIGDMQLGNLPIFILPTTKLTEGDLIKDGGEYYFVNKVEAGSTQTLCAKTGEMKTVIPIKNVMGFSCYSKVIAFSDSVNMGGDFDIEKLAIMSAMSGQSGEDGGQMNQMLPLMLFKDKLGGDDDMMKMMLVSSMMTPQAEGGDQNAGMNQLLPFMLMKGKDGDDDDMMKMMFMSSMMGGNMAGNNNPVMNYLMLDMFMGKKKEEKAQQPAQTPPENPAE